ncbi:MAG: rhomboid family intramembrane serine protease [Gammaproteobacteria bacterium]|nr:rhomboid family intramembrane serine protease [Gammaproteobacteria bacterium]
MLGASGAIAGLMGLYTVLYGKRKVRFFYWFFVFFDYVKKPAIILLPLWLGWELIQFFFGGYGVAYEAHIGGIIGGVLLGLGILKLGWENRDFLDEETRRDHDRDLFSEAMDDLKELRVDAARQKLKQLLPQHGRDLELLKRYYNTCKLQPEHPDFHDAARRVLLHTDQGTEQNTLIRDTFRDYARTAKGKIRLSQSERETLTIRLANWGYLQEAGLLANALLKQANPSPESAEAILALGHACSVQGNPSNAKHYLLQIIQRFPSSREAVTARDLLKSLDPQAR